VVVLAPGTDPQKQREIWDRDGWYVLEGVLSPQEAAAARAELKDRYVPDLASVWREPDPELKAEQFVGITEFPFWQSALLNRVTLDERLISVAADLLETPDVVLYMAQAWGKYTGAADYDQLLHRDFRNHTLVVPDQSRREYAQVETMLYLSDVGPGHGPTHLVSRSKTRHLPINPEFMDRNGNEWLYELEESAAAPAGSLLVYSPDVFHRGTNLVEPDGSRFVISIGFQPRLGPWAGYHCWPKAGSWPPLLEFIAEASPRQLSALGFPLPGDPYWTETTRSQTAERYPTLGLAAYLDSN
jgi:hypothetical protein